MATAGRLAQIMGGSVDVSSTPGVGSVFTVKLPFRETASVASPWLNSPGGEPSRPARVLLVEDHPTTQGILKGLIEELGSPCVAVRGGEEALHLLSSPNQDHGEFDVALIDFNNPQLNGIDWVRRLKAQDLCPRMRLVLLAAGASSEEVRRACAAGFHGLLSKPVRKSELKLVTGGGLAWALIPA